MGSLGSIKAVPKEHTNDLLSASPDIACKIIKIAKKIAPKIIKAVGVSDFNLIINKTNALISTNGDVDVVQDFTISPGAYFTNSTGDNFNVLGNTTFEANASGMASFIDDGTTTLQILLMCSYSLQTAHRAPGTLFHRRFQVLNPDCLPEVIFIHLMNLQIPG